MGQLSEFFRRLPIVHVSAHVQERKGVSKEGKPYERREQVGYLARVDEYGEETRERVKLALGRGDSAIAPGMYVLSGDAVEVNRFGELELRRFEKPLLLVPQPLMNLVETDQKRVNAAA